MGGVWKVCLQTQTPRPQSNWDAEKPGAASDIRDLWLNMEVLKDTSIYYLLKIQCGYI